MDEIHNISEGSTVRVTETSGGPTVIDDLQVGDDEIYEWLQEGVELTVRSIKEAHYGNKVIVHFVAKNLSGYKTITAGTYPEGINGWTFDADGHNTQYSDKYFDVEVLA